MGRWNSCFGKDPDELFAYASPKVVLIRDRRLGLLNYFFMFAILVYVALWQIIGNNGYLRREAPVGSVRFSLLRPLANPSCDTPDCPSLFRPTFDLPYCTQYNGSSPAPNRNPCQYLDAMDISSALERSFVVATRISRREERRTCGYDDNVQHCVNLFNDTDDHTTFMADIESYTMMVDHTVQAPSIRELTGSARLLHGRIYVPSSDHMCATGAGSSSPKAPCYIDPNTTSTNLDIFNIGSALEIFDTPNLDKRRVLNNKSFREDGIIVVLEIEYTNFVPWKGVLSEIAYTYKFTRLFDTNYKQLDIVYTDFPRERTFLNKHGIRFVVMQTGQLGEFDVTTLLLQLTTSMTLLATATFLVDKLALYVMPEKKLYFNAKFDVTEDFSEIRDRARHGSTLDEGIGVMPAFDKSGSHAEMVPSTRVQPLLGSRTGAERALP